MIAFRGLAWTLWRRNRLVVISIAVAMLAYGAALALCRVERIPVIVNVLGPLYLVIGYLVLMGMFIHQDADVASDQSSYPSHLFTLPVTTGQLVLVPMLLGTVLLSGSALLLTAAARHSGVAIGLFWPAALIAELLALLQAIFWFPLGIPYGKLVLTLVALPATSVGVIVALNSDISEGAVCGALLGVTACCYPIAWLGVSRARRGDVRNFRLSRITEVKRSTVRELSPFRSAAAAQVWYEYRQQGRVLPMMAAVLIGLFALPLVSESTLTNTQLVAGPRQPMVSTYVWYYFPNLLLLLLLAAWIVGCGARRSDLKRGDRTFQLFYGTRPQTDGGLLNCKLMAAAKGMAATCGLLLVVTLPLLLMRGGTMDAREG